MIEAVKQVRSCKAIQIAQVADHPRYRIHLATQGYLDGVIMPVAVRIVALAEDSIVARVVVGCTMQTV
jgi:CRISPR/Cas system CMR-associated protein Cmr3 (group 5 of RAMP superfamily)